MTLTRLLAFVLCAAPSWSATVYTNIGPDDAYGANYTIYAGSWVAAQFAPSESGPLDTVLLPLVRYGDTGATGPLLVSLRAPGPDPTGAALESWTLAPEAVSPPPGMIHVLESSLRPDLTAGSAYWLRVESSGPLPFQSYGWAQNVTGDPGPAAVSLNGGLSWAAAGQNPAFELNTASQAIPEPAPAGLLALGLAVVVFGSRKRK